MISGRLFFYVFSTSFAGCIAASNQNIDGEVQTNNTNGSQHKTKLIFAHVLFRHGDRTPVEPYPTDPWKNISDWPTGWGQLTNIGKTQHYELGKWLRKRYGAILSQTYSNDEIYVKSTDVDRTLMSALSNLAGLYPPLGKDVWNERIDWQPIPVHTVPGIMDEVLSGQKPCPAYAKALSELYSSTEFKNFDIRYKSLYDYLTTYTGRKVNRAEHVLQINNTLFIEELYNKSLPTWTQKVYRSSDMTFVTDFSFSIKTHTRELARLRIGQLLKEILQRCKDKGNKVLKPDRSMWIYSGHDITIADLLNSLKLFELHSPPYAACIMIELRKNANNQLFVSIFYKNTTDEPSPMNIPGCGTACPLEKMYTLYDDIIPKDWERECMSTSAFKVYIDAETKIVLRILVVIILIMTFISYITVTSFRRRSYTKSINTGSLGI